MKKPKTNKRFNRKKAIITVVSTLTLAALSYVGYRIIK